MAVDSVKSRASDRDSDFALGGPGGPPDDDAQAGQVGGTAQPESVSGTQAESASEPNARGLGERNAPSQGQYSRAQSKDPLPASVPSDGPPAGLGPSDGPGPDGASHPCRINSDEYRKSRWSQ